MPPPTRRFFAWLALCVLTLASFFAGYAIALRSRADPTGQAARPVQTTARSAVAATPTANNGPRDPHAATVAARAPGSHPDRAAMYRQMLAALNEPISTE